MRMPRLLLLPLPSFFQCRILSGRLFPLVSPLRTWLRSPRALLTCSVLRALSAIWRWPHPGSQQTASSCERSPLATRTQTSPQDEVTDSSNADSPQTTDMGTTGLPTMTLSQEPRDPGTNPGSVSDGFCVLCQVTSVTSDSATPWTIAHQVPVSMGSSRQEYWSGFAVPSSRESS